MLGELAVFEAYDVGGDPCRRAAVPRKAAVGDDVVSFAEDDVIFVTQRVGKAANEVEQAIAARRNMGAVLDVAVRPVAFGGSVVPLVEQRVEGFENEGLVLLRCGLGHGSSPVASGLRTVQIGQKRPRFSGSRAPISVGASSR